MLNALWVVLLGMAALFVIQALIFLIISLMKKLDPLAKKQREKG
jgi:hypothetical protein